MRVIVNGHDYIMRAIDANRLLKVSKNMVPFGIYAVEKDRIIELRCDIALSDGHLKRMIQDFKKNGFRVYWNDIRAKQANC